MCVVPASILTYVTSPRLSHSRAPLQPGRQFIGSFNPLPADGWADEVHLPPGSHTYCRVVLATVANDKALRRTVLQALYEADRHMKGFLKPRGIRSSADTISHYRCHR